MFRPGAMIQEGCSSRRTDRSIHLWSGDSAGGWTSLSSSQGVREPETRWIAVLHGVNKRSKPFVLDGHFNRRNAMHFWAPQMRDRAR